MMGIDYALPMSDHCDYNELIQVVHKCNPKKIFTIHGFAHEFARILNNMGYNASPIDNHHSNKIRKTRKESITKNNRIKSSISTRKRSSSNSVVNSRISNNNNNNILILDYFFK